MKQSLLKQVRLIVVCVCSLFVMLLFSACSGALGTTGTNAGNTLTGSLQSVNAATHSVVLNVNGQTITVSNLTDQQITALKTQVGKTYSFHVEGTQSGSNSYTIGTNTEPIESDNATPVVESTTTADTNNSGVNEPGSLSFIGKVQSASGSTLVVAMPNGQTLAANIVNGQSDLSKFGGNLPAVNTVVKVNANANTDGSFLLAELDTTGTEDVQNTTQLNTVDIQGTTTQAVGSDNVVHLKVGNKNFAFATSPNTELKDFANVRAIASNQTIKVEVLFNGSNGTLLKAENGND
ncbi:MAG: hypothetical protein NVSMB49_19110 [Ktedonobacteraceae bacterium]